MRYKTVLLLIGILLLAVVAAQIMLFQEPYNPTAQRLRDTSLWMAQLLGLFLVAAHGSCIKTAYFKVMLFFWAGLTLGTGFVIMHWPYGREMVVGFCVSLAATYLLWFYQKPRKQRLDWLKLLWVLAVSVVGVSIFQHWLPRSLLPIPQVFFWLMMLDFSYQNYSNRYT